jgi:hypothetical protein
MSAINYLEFLISCTVFKVSPLCEGGRIRAN